MQAWLEGEAPSAFVSPCFCHCRENCKLPCKIWVSEMSVVLFSNTAENFCTMCEHDGLSVKTNRRLRLTFLMEWRLGGAIRGPVVAFEIEVDHYVWCVRC